jgi:farnesol dehydrogenase
VKVLLTGGTGFLGQRVARALLEAGHELRLLARPLPGIARRTGLPEKAELATGDVTDADSMMRAAEGCHAVVHLAALVKVWVPDPSAFDHVNVGGLQNALRAAAAAGARLVYTSSFIAIGPAGPEPANEERRHPGDRFRNHYERTKATADVLALEACARGEDVVVLYPGVIYGPGEMTEGNIVVRMIADHLQGKMPGIIGPGDRLWSYSFVEDVARGHVAALERGRKGERYFLCGDNVDMNGLFERVAALTGVPAPTRHIPYAVARALGLLLYAWAELTGHPPLLTHEVVDVFRAHWAYDSTKAQRELAYEVTPLREGLQRTVAWMREAGLA